MGALGGPGAPLDAGGEMSFAPGADAYGEGGTRNYKSNQLIILLVVVPLGVGAAAVCLVFLNYHCKM